ncbi:LuxR C-terminal-related transcriptional regulator [Tritonibacter mobilis]|uniref:LuxR C-terminal-related transcriptional regulator n=1 Tax=Tritonibacter mobilis TaxID=379347 RepID=UPI003A5BB47A
MEPLSTLAFESAPVGLIYAEDRVIKLCNTRFSEMFGYRKAELEGHSLSKLYPSSDEFQRIGQIGVEKMRGLGRYADERIMRRKDESLFWCRVRGQSLAPQDPFAQSVWSFADISEKRPVTEMTRRERQVAKMLAEGLTSKEIARGLEISPRTVEVHRARLMNKFGARNGLELVANLAGLPLGGTS